MDDQTQSDKQQGPLIETLHDTQAQQKDEPITNALHLLVVAPEKTLFDGIVESITSKNKSGTFDILPFHENFISLIEDKITLREKGKPPQDIPVGNSILKASKNRVEVYIGVDSLIPQPEQTPQPAGK